MKASDIMSSPTLTARVKTPFKDIVEIFVNQNVHHIPVVNADNSVRAIFSSNDALRSVHNLDAVDTYMNSISLEQRVSLRDEMTSDVVTASKDTPVLEIIEMMVSNNMNSVLIVEEEMLVGIVTTRDIMKAISYGKYQLTVGK